MIHAPITPAAAITRTATVEYNHFFPAMPHQVRCYGQGRCTVGEGIPHRFASKARADGVAATWIADGISPANQDVSLAPVTVSADRTQVWA